MNRALVEQTHLGDSLASRPQTGEDVRKYKYGPRLSFYVADTIKAAEVVASRHLSGEEKKTLLRGAVEDALDLAQPLLFSWGRVGQKKVECVILRGADHVRPVDPGQVIGPLERTALRMSREEIGPRQWKAIMLPGTLENGKALFSAEHLIVWDGCSASVSTLQGLSEILKQRNQHLISLTIVCPIMSDLAPERLSEVAERLGININVLCFGLYHVERYGWHGKTETDLVVPSDKILHSNPLVKIPKRQIMAYRNSYGIKPNKRGPCIVGDISQSMSDDRQDVLEYIVSTIEEWTEFCNIPVPGYLLVSLAKLLPLNQDVKNVLDGQMWMLGGGEIPKSEWSPSWTEFRLFRNYWKELTQMLGDLKAGGFLGQPESKESSGKGSIATA